MIVTELFKKGTEPTEVSTKHMKLNSPTGFSVKDNKTSVSLSWNAVQDLEYVENGIFGYYIYFENKQMGFTTNTNYVINNLQSYIGTYSIKAGYKDTQDCLSDATTYKLEEKKEYNLSINGNKQTVYTVGSPIDQSLYNGTIVKLLENGIDITQKANINIRITNSSNETITTIPNDKADSYKINYTVTYGSYFGTCYNEILIQ